MFAQAGACIRSEHQRLTELDSIGGDGDHGTTMLRAAEQMEDWAGHSEPAEPCRCAQGHRLASARCRWRRFQQSSRNVLRRDG